MAYSWFQIVETFRLGHRPKESDSEIDGWRSLGLGFITTIHIKADMERFISIDCFPFLYEMMTKVFCIRTPTKFEMLIGEGWVLLGTPLNGRFEFQLAFERPDRGDLERLFKWDLSVSDAMLFFSTKIAEIVSSLETIGVDVERYISMCPPDVYRPGIFVHG